MDDCADTIGAKTEMRTSYKYDGMGQLIEEAEFDEENVAISTDVYKYDNIDGAGNWRKLIKYSTLYTSSCKTKVWVTERRIEYY